ncbi:MAG: hypothetical protein RMJ98_21345 [Myxococcales bacterium]|nr:hypothetical protein [Polyangiaceae bacterium]MDW8251850.1 hypothetical protein [Myxococcales bacterium]
MSDRRATSLIPAPMQLLLRGWLVWLCAGCRVSGAASPGGVEASLLAHYLDLPRATAPSLSRDGRRVAFLSDLPGLPQPYALELSAPGDPPAGPSSFVRLATLPHRTQLVRWLDGGKRALLGYDHGGNENTQFSLIQEDGGLLSLTDRPASRHLFGAIDLNKKRLAYSSDERNGRDFDVMLRDLSSGETRLLYQGIGHLEPRAFSYDGSALLLVEKRSSSDEALHLLSIPPQGVGSLMPLTFYRTPVRHQDACFLGPLVLVLSDHDREYLSLVFHNALSPSEPPVSLLTEQGDLDVLACSPSGDRFAVARNMDGRHELHIYKIARAVERQQVPTPLLRQGVPLAPPRDLPRALGCAPPGAGALGAPWSLGASFSTSAWATARGDPGDGILRRRFDPCSAARTLHRARSALDDPGR